MLDNHVCFDAKHAPHAFFGCTPLQPFAHQPSTAGKPSRATGCTRGWPATHPRNGSESPLFGSLGFWQVAFLVR
jgi:hypothetical protein